MHYYKRNIGDYHKKAGRLSMIEHGAYTLLIDACYDRERFPTRDDAIDWLWARSDEEIASIDFVLSKFFHLQEDGTYTQDRIQQELDAYHAMAETNQRIAKEREAKRREARSKKKGLIDDSNKEARSVDESPPNQEPLTTNHELITNNQENGLDVFEKTYNDMKNILVKSGIIPVGKRVNDEQLKPDIYTFVAWCDGKKMEEYKRTNAVVGYFKKKGIDYCKRFYTFEGDVKRNYYNPDDYKKSIPVSDEAAAAIKAKYMGALGM